MRNRAGVDRHPEHHGGNVDVMTFAKGVAGAVPLSGFIATDELGKMFDTGDRSIAH